jgi:PLP dependent protein
VVSLREHIAGAASGRSVEIVGVTKGFGSDAITAALSAGLTMIGENYAKELLAKVATLERRPTIHFIGRLQSNKVRQLVDVVDVWESIDRPSLLDEVARRRPGGNVLIQINTTGEPTKGGCPPAQVEVLAEQAHSLDLNLNGVMTVGPTDGDPRGTVRAFQLARRFADELGLPTCSMGMSEDLDIALASGTTRVRLGSALFGPRPRH